MNLWIKEAGGLAPRFYMTREEFFEWLDTCPTHKWEITHEEYGHVVVSFPNEEEEEEE